MGPMIENKNNESAKELWLQIFSRAAKSEFAAIQDPHYDEAIDEARLVQGLKASGWKEEDAQLILQRGRIERANAPVTSPGVNPSVEAHLERLSDCVEWAMDHLGMGSYAKVARGVEPRAWASASKINVIMTDESIVTVSAFLFRFCGLIARAYIRTIRLNPYGWSNSEFDPEWAYAEFRRRPDLLSYWLKIYLSFAVTGTHANVPYKPSTPDEVLPFEDIAHAMEIFAIAHEYGHHHHQHGRTLHEDEHREEFEADRFALKISAALDEKMSPLPNPYLTSGAGGVIMLLALRTLKAVERALGLSNEAINNTHPDIPARIARFDSIAILQPMEFLRLKSFRLAGERVLNAAHNMIMPAISRMPQENILQLKEFRSEGG